MKHVILLTLLAFVLNLSEAQDRNAVLMVAKASEGSIKLRWAPGSSSIWELANKYGYTLERYTIIRDSMRLSPAEQEVVASPVLKPAAKEAWQSLIEDDDHAAVVAQAIYGETFELTDNFDKDIFQVAQKTQERDQRYSFALFAADQSFEIARLAGLGYEDDRAKPGEKYLYRVYANIPLRILSVDTAVAYIGLEDVAPLPVVGDFKAAFGDKYVVLSWDKTMIDRFYNAFWIERSTDGENFRSITDSPIINAYSEGNGKSGTYFKLDSLTDNETKVFYRIRGMNTFGEQGPFSEVISGKGVPVVDAYAVIQTHEVNKDGTARIHWDYPDHKEKLIEGFTLKVGGTPKGPYEVVEKMLSKSERNYLIQQPKGTGYYTLGLLIGGKEMNFSFPYLVQLADSIPPKAPQQVEAVIDQRGKVSIKWSKNTESDLWGYRVLRSNFRSAEFSEITTQPLEQNQFEDSLALDNLTEQIYYQVIAVDKRDNRSEGSEVIELQKPDIVAPAPPVILRAEGKENGIYLEWGKSSSLDVTSHRIYRAIAGTGQWELITIVDSLNFYLDTASIVGKPHLYTLLAVDDVGLESTPSAPVRVSRKATIPQVEYKGFSGRSERENKRIALFWETAGDQVKAIKLYRSVGEGPARLYKTLKVTDQFLDENVIQNRTYSYQLKAVLTNGYEGGFSEKVEVRY